jgi:hypothetical protein
MVSSFFCWKIREDDLKQGVAAFLDGGRPSQPSHGEPSVISIAQDSLVVNVLCVGFFPQCTIPFSAFTTNVNEPERWMKYSTRRSSNHVCTRRCQGVLIQGSFPS